MAGAKLSARPQIATIDVADFLYIVDADETAGLAQSKYVTVSQLDSRFGAGGGASLTIDTRSNILASSPAAAAIAFSTDTNEHFIWDGSAWYVSDAVFSLVAGVAGGQWDFSDADQSAHFVLWAFN